MICKCEMCFKELIVGEYNSVKLEGEKYNVTKIICNNCIKKISTLISKNDRRDITHTIRNIIGQDGKIVFELKFICNNELLVSKYFETYTEANNTLLYIIKIKNRYGKAAFMGAIKKLKGE